ncbi:hypothetical protein KDX38_28575 [Pseudomonas sp. CDFA 602]|nr:hypothetical protein [Pseudomonas californiensis]MCD6003109.1 hypothetical protein [Pseudomonas californiensis]
MLEAWNVSSESETLAQSLRERNQTRVIGGLLAATLDLAIAAEALTVKILSREPKSFTTRKAILKFSEDGITRWLGGKLGSIAIREISLRLIAQLFSGTLLTALNLHDTWHAWQRNDQAMYGYLLMSMGGLSTILSSALGGMKLFAGLNLLGWAALLLLIGGAGLVVWLSSTPLVDWLANGPFGQSKTKESSLESPSEALYKLIGLLAGITITIEENPAYEPHAKFDFRAQIPYAVRSANTIIRLESRLPGLIDNLDSLNIRAECRLCRITERTNNQGVPYKTGTEIAAQSTTPKAQRHFINKIELLFFTPSNKTRTSEWSTIHHFKWAVRAQFILTTRGEKHYFPAPSIRERAQYHEEQAAPDFTAINQPFWADEITHKN